MSVRVISYKLNLVQQNLCEILDINLILDAFPSENKVACLFHVIDVNILIYVLRDMAVLLLNTGYFVRNSDINQFGQVFLHLFIAHKAVHIFF